MEVLKKIVKDKRIRRLGRYDDLYYTCVRETGKNGYGWACVEGRFDLSNTEHGKNEMIQVPYAWFLRNTNYTVYTEEELKKF